MSLLGFCPEEGVGGVKWASAVGHVWIAGGTGAQRPSTSSPWTVSHHEWGPSKWTCLCGKVPSDPWDGVKCQPCAPGRPQPDPPPTVHPVLPWASGCLTSGTTGSEPTAFSVFFFRVVAWSMSMPWMLFPTSAGLTPPPARACCSLSQLELKGPPPLELTAHPEPCLPALTFSSLH